MNFPLFKKYIIELSVLVVIFLALLSYIYIGKLFFQPKLIKNVKYTNINFNNRSKNADMSAIKEFYESTNAPIEEIDIDFKVKINSIYNWNNIFQTAAFNKGVRMELALPSTLGVVISDGTERGYVDYIITYSLRIKEWYSLRLNIDINKRIKVFLNDNITVNVKDRRMNFLISDIAVGTGFSRSRPFDGEINNFNLRYSLFKENEYWRRAGFVLLFFYLLIISFYVSLRRRKGI